MSQMGQFGLGIETITGDAGGAVDADVNGNLNLVGTAGLVDVTGFPITNTLQIDLDGSVTAQYDCDVGTAIPVAHILNINGAHGINTLGALDVVTIALNNTITLGDLAPVIGNALTITTGDATITAGDLVLSAGDIQVTGSIAVSTLTDHGILIGHGASNVTSSTLTDGQLLIGKTGAFDPVATTITPGTNISVTNGAGSITIASAGLGIFNYTNVAVTPYVSIATDNYLSVDTSALAITIKLPDAATANRSYTIKDRIGDAATRNITVTTVTGAVLIDGAATFVMNTAYESVNIIGNGSTYEVW